MSSTDNPLSWGELNQLAAAVALLRGVVEGKPLPATLDVVNYPNRLNILERRLADLMVGRP